MNKFCIFCGKKPKNKNNEHVIPKWLIELTGDPNRVVYFGPIFNDKTMALETREFAFDQFQFPSCESCNHKYSELEINAKNVVKHLINNDALSAADFMVLFDWMDKVRVGLWLPYNYLSKNISEVEPNYHIANRIGNSDRAIFIYKSDSAQSGINFTGVNVPAFQYYPICFNLRINQYCLFNLSTDFVISKYLGLPYSDKSYYTDGQSIKHVLAEGKKRILPPIVRAAYDKRCAEIYQPIFPHYEGKERIEHLYNTDHAKSLSHDQEKGVGKILVSEKNKIVEYPLIESKDWIPKNIWKMPDLMRVIAKQVFEFQNYYLNRGPSYAEVSEEKKNLIKEQLFLAKKVNKLFIKIADEE